MESGSAGALTTSGIPACAAAGTYSIQHASRFDVGAGNTTDITDICIGTAASSISAVQIYSATGVANDDHDIWYTFTIPFDGTWDVLLPASGIDQAVAVRQQVCPPW